MLPTITKLSLTVLTASAVLATASAPIAAREVRDTRDLSPVEQHGHHSPGLKLAFKSMNGNTVEKGELIHFQMRANHDGYLYLYTVNASGRVQLL